MRVENRYLDTGDRGKGGVHDHEMCDGRGVLFCGKCKAGRTACPQCIEGKTTTCVLCGGKRDSTCGGCAEENSIRPLELSGRILLERAEAKAAIPYFETALLRAEAHLAETERKTRSALDQFSEDAEGIDKLDAVLRASIVESARKAIEKALEEIRNQKKKEIKRLRDLLAKAKASASR